MLVTARPRSQETLAAVTPFEAAAVAVAASHAVPAVRFLSHLAPARARVELASRSRAVSALFQTTGRLERVTRFPRLFATAGFGAVALLVDHASITQLGGAVAMGVGLMTVYSIIYPSVMYHRLMRIAAEAPLTPAAFDRHFNAAVGIGGVPTPADPGHLQRRDIDPSDNVDYRTGRPAKFSKWQNIRATFRFMGMVPHALWTSWWTPRAEFAKLAPGWFRMAARLWLDRVHGAITFEGLERIAAYQAAHPDHDIAFVATHNGLYSTVLAPWASAALATGLRWVADAQNFITGRKPRLFLGLGFLLQKMGIIPTYRELAPGILERLAGAGGIGSPLADFLKTMREARLASLKDVVTAMTAEASQAGLQAGVFVAGTREVIGYHENGDPMDIPVFTAKPYGNGRNAHVSSRGPSGSIYSAVVEGGRPLAIFPVAIRGGSTMLPKATGIPPFLNEAVATEQQLHVIIGEPVVLEQPLYRSREYIGLTDDLMDRLADVAQFEERVVGHFLDAVRWEGQTNIRDQYRTYVDSLDQRGRHYLWTLIARYFTIHPSVPMGKTDPRSARDTWRGKIAMAIRDQAKMGDLKRLLAEQAPFVPSYGNHQHMAAAFAASQPKPARGPDPSDGGPSIPRAPGTHRRRRWSDGLPGFG